MIETFLLAAAISSASVDPYPRNLSEPQYSVTEEQVSVKFWVVLDPKCVVESVSNEEGSLGTEITFLEPENVTTSQVISFVMMIEDFEPSEDVLIFLEANDEGTELYTATKNGHRILWKRDADTRQVKKVLILYHDKSQNS